MKLAKNSIPDEDPISIDTKAWDRLEADGRKRLAQKVAENSIPPKPYMPAASDVIIYREPPGEEKEKTEGGLHIPEGYWGKTREGESVFIEVKFKPVIPVGILIAAGLEARDWLLSHGILVGDTVFFAEWDGRERDFNYDKSKVYKREDDLKKFLQLYVSSIRGSVEAVERIEGKQPKLRRKRIIDSKGNFLHIYSPVPENIE